MNGFFSKRTLADMMSAASSDTNMKRTLGVWGIIALGVGAVVGAGLFVRTAAAAGNGAGVAVMLSFALAAVACLFSGLCYAELSAMIPASGSAYSYAYVALGKGLAILVGWALMQEYAFAVSAVAGAAVEYVNSLFGNILPFAWTHSPMQRLVEYTDGEQIRHVALSSWEHVPGGATNVKTIAHGIVNLPAMVIIFLVTLLLIRGTQKTSLVNSIMVIVKIVIVIVFVLMGWQFIRPENTSPFLVPKSSPSYDTFFHYGFGGILSGAAIVFFAFIGFDAVSTTAQEVINPQKNLPRGILGTLILCTALYILFGYVLTGVVNYKDLAGKEAPISYAIDSMSGFSWLKPLMEVAILVSFFTVEIATLYGQSRVLFAMSHDKMLPSILGKTHPKYGSPYIAIASSAVLTMVMAGFCPVDLTGGATSFGTLFAFISVCICTIVLRAREPKAHRPFRTPLVPLVPILGILFCTVLIVSLNGVLLAFSASWLAIGLIYYFVHASRLKAA